MAAIAMIAVRGRGGLRVRHLLRASWTIRATATPGDALFGLALAAVVAIVLGALAVLLERRLYAVRAGLRVRIVVALFATGLITGAAQAAGEVFTSW
ncbi:MAG: hypothetical protein U0359_15775 [Byssovorax sp.]